MEHKEPNATFEQNVLQRLDRIEALLHRLAGDGVTAAPAAQPMAIPAAEPPKPETPQTDDTLEKTRKWYNQLWDTGLSQAGICERIQTRMAGDPNACVIGFRDDALCLTDNTYAEFARSKNGRAFILTCEPAQDGKMLFIVLPYPCSDIWFERGSVLLERMYALNGNGYYLNPRIQISSVALLEGTRAGESEHGEMIYRPYRMGQLKVQMVI